MDDEIKKIKRTQIKILFTMSEILGYVKIEHHEKLANKLNNISNEINYNDDELYNEINLLKTQNESLTNRIRMLEEDFERLKKAQLEKYFEYSTEDESEEEYEDKCTVGGRLIKFECNNSDCSECQRDKYY